MIWMRNLLFLSLVGGGLFTVGYQLIPPRAPKPVTRYDATAYNDPQFRDTVDRVDASFHEQWYAAELRPAQSAPDLLVARRLSLGLIGTVPSLEEIRQLETLAPGTTTALVDRPPLARPPFRRLLCRTAGPRLRRHRRWTVYLLSPQPVHLVAGRKLGQ